MPAAVRRPLALAVLCSLVVTGIASAGNGGIAPLEGESPNADRIVDAYWCLTDASAVVLTSKQTSRWPRRHDLRLYRATDWVTSAAPRIAALLHHSDSLAMKANQILPVHFVGQNASRDVTIYPGQTVISEPLGIDIAAGTVVFTHTVVQPNNGTANTGSTIVRAR